MAYGTKYRCEFTDILGLNWDIYIQVDPDPGSVITLQASGSPMILEWYGEDDIFEQNIFGSMMSLNIEADSDFYFSSLFTSNNLEYKVIVYQGVTEFWHGYILANNYSEPYDKTPFSVSLIATDGLGLLKDFKFKDLGYTTRQKTSVVINAILELIGVTQWTEYVNLHESTMNSAVGDSPFDQSGVDPDLWKEATCYDALSGILKSFSAGIKQDQGAFVIYRYVELKDASMKGRIFTDGTTKSATTKAPLQYINRPTQASNFWDYEGGMMTMVPHIETINVNQDYGFKGSILKNYNFPYDEFTWDTDHWDMAGWTIGASGYFQPVSMTNAQWLGARDLDGDMEGALMINRNFTTLDDYYTQTVVGITSTDKLVIELEVSLISYDGVDDTGTLYVELISTNGVNTKYFYAANGTWDATQRFIQESIDCSKDLTWKKFSYTIDELPYSGDFTVNIWSGFDPDGTPGNIMAAYKNVSIYWATSEGVPPAGIAYTVTNTVTGQIVDKEFTVGDGYGFDNDHLQYAGALNVWSGAAPVPTSKSWHTRGATENKPLIEVIGNELGNQFARHKQLIDLPLREMHDDEFLSLTGNLQDVLNQTGGSNRVFAIAAGVFNVKDREWELRLTELI